MARQIDGLALGTIAAGSLFAYAGIKGYSIPVAIQALIRGRPPASAGQAYPITTSSVPSSQGISGSPLAQDMLNYAGKVPYVWGGATPKGWDCSGSVNYVANRIAGLPIPGFAPGRLTGHGPTTWGWLAWAPAHMLHIAAANTQAGDIVLWQTHMGIMINATQYVSAYDPQMGTVVQPVHGGGPIGEVATFWRYKLGTPGVAAQNPNPLTGVST